MKNLSFVLPKFANFIFKSFFGPHPEIRFLSCFLPFVFILCPSLAGAVQVNLAWNSSTGPNVAGYKMHYGNYSGNYQYTVNVGNSTSCTISGLTEGMTYYFAATAYDNQLNESSYSNEVKYVLSGVVPKPVGDLDYCRDFGPCAAGEGDCDTDSECQSGLTCVQVPGTDTCQGAASPLPVGDLDYCRDFGPCSTGQGDCDTDSECEVGLTCVQVTGVDTCQGGVSPLPVGDLDYCRDFGPCGAGQGDCDNNSECQSGLTCVQVTGTDKCCPYPIGHLDYCRVCGPCGAGQGDCDNNTECQSGLVCAQVPGVDTCR